MKKRNIAVGDYVVYWESGEVIKVVSDYDGKLNCNSIEISEAIANRTEYRRPVIEDLTFCDVFEAGGERFVLIDAYINGHYAFDIDDMFGALHSFDGETKVKIISLASDENADLDIIDKINETIGPDEISVDTRERVYRTKYVNGGEFLTTHPAPGLDIIKTFVEIPNEDE